MKQNQFFEAPEFEVNDWIDADGNKTKPIKLSDFKGKFKVVFCFQSWCRGCHSKGLPDLKRMVDVLKENENVVFLAVQTVFEGHDSNTYDRMVKTQKQYDLKIPFGHDPGSHGRSGSNIMFNYKTGGTPWFLFIDKDDNVVFSDFHLIPRAAIKLLETM
ncbi:peroxiredoxin family protein [Cognatitamlana onchidii]|uniref:peroxiredoxin family protein n=1 Tax=Cognatitamlana onchidii TaxID=2562860 RepID=UPI001F316EA5|nr:redoxin domain-containing protein [Algibacter onchidii]